jgi:hypothetical protein
VVAGGRRWHAPREFFRGCGPEGPAQKCRLNYLYVDLLAFLFHTVLEWSDDKYALLRQVIARRQSLFHDIQTLMRYMVFDNWHHLMDFMIRGLELESQFDTS